MHCKCRGASVLKSGHQPLYYFVYMSSEGSGKCTYTHAQTCLSLHCATLRQVPKSNGLIPLICSFVTSKSSLFDLNHANIIIVSTIMFTFDMLNINFILSATKFHCKTNGSN